MQNAAPATTQKASTYPDGYLIALLGFAGALLGFLVQNNSISLVAVLVTILGLLRAQWQSLLVLSYPIYGLGGALVSNFFIEKGAYITEQFRTGEMIGSTASLAALTSAFLVVGHVAVVQVTRKYFGAMVLSDEAGRRLRKLLTAGVLIALLMYASTIAVFGGGWSLAGARFEFWASLPPLVGQPMKLVQYYAAPAAFGLASFYIFNLRRAPKLLILLMLMIPVAMFATGEKASGFIVLATYVGAGAGLAAIGRGVRRSIGGRLILAVAVIGAAIAWAASLGYQESGSTNSIDAIGDRSILQGHVWYGIHMIATEDALVPIRELIRPNEQGSPSGLDRISYLITSSRFLEPRFRDGISFTMGGPAVAVAGFGTTIGTILWVLSALLYAWAVRIGMIFLRRGGFIFTGITFAYMFTLHQVTMMGNWEFLYHPIALCFYAVAVFAFFRDGAPATRKGTPTIEVAGPSSSRPDPARRP